MQPQLKRSVASDEEIEIMTKRKGKVTFSSHHPPQVVKHDEDPDDISNGVLDYENGSHEAHESFQDQEDDSAYNIGDNFKIARPILSRTTSVGRLVNNFENLEETRSLAGDVRARSPPLTNSQRRFGTLTRQRTNQSLER